MSCDPQREGNSSSNLYKSPPPLTACQVHPLECVACAESVRGGLRTFHGVGEDLDQNEIDVPRPEKRSESHSSELRAQLRCARGRIREGLGRRDLWRERGSGWRCAVTVEGVVPTERASGMSARRSIRGR